MKKDLVVVTIPIYKEIPDAYEEVSFKQCLEVLKNYPIRIVAPEGLNLDHYFNLCPAARNLVVVSFRKSYFKNIFGYNRLLLSREFYQTFSKFEYILIYQPDAYVFKDELAYWCAKGYDYVGAPGFKLRNEETRFQFSGVANGGFSLRKVSAMMYLISNWQKYFGLFDILSTKLLNFNSKTQLAFDYLMQGLPNAYKKIPLTIFYKHHEDFVLTVIFSKEAHALNLPEPLEAAKFAFEVHAGMLYELNKQELPFGCHAWYKHETEFWSKFIPALSEKEVPLPQV